MVTSYTKKLHYQFTNTLSIHKLIILIIYFFIEHTYFINHNFNDCEMVTSYTKKLHYQFTNTLSIHKLIILIIYFFIEHTYFINHNFNGYEN
jgi:hypothetical protein